MGTLVWFKRDLRLADHPALWHAAQRGPVLPVYIVEPALWQQPDASGRQWAFVRESLMALRDALAERGLPLVVRQGPAVAVLQALCAAHGISRMASHEEIGNGWTYARDRAVAAWARGAGIVWEEWPQSGVVRRLSSRDGWAATRDRYMAAPIPALPPLISVLGAVPGDIPAEPAPFIAPDPCPGRQQGGRSAGLALLDSFLADRGEPYRRAMSSPLSGKSACSRLSPHLAWGTLSGREADQAAARAQRWARGGGWPGALTSFRARLAWRDHFMQKLEDEPAIERRCLDPMAETLRAPEADETRLSAWAEGRTGLPFLDACMRSLRATGWLNFRMRSMVMAVASYHLWLDWRVTGPVLAQLFTDYEPGIHWPQVQMQSGTTGINTPRIYNPVKQGRDQDPDGQFTRRWCPELAHLPADRLQTPWLAEGAPGYPPPIVDPDVAARAARQRIWALRQAPGHRAVAEAIVKRHGSRKDSQRRFVRDSLTQAPRQLSLDL